MNNPQLAILCILCCAIGYAINQSPEASSEATAEPVQAQWVFDEIDEPAEIVPLTIEEFEELQERLKSESQVQQGYDCVDGVCDPRSQRRGIFGGLFRR